MDKVAEKLNQIEPLSFGLTPDQNDTYCAIVLKNFLLQYRQDKREQIMRLVLKPKDFRILAKGDAARIVVLAADISANKLHQLVTQGLRIAINEIEEEMQTDGGMGDELRSLAFRRLTDACEHFDPRKVSKGFVSFLFAVYSLIMSD